MSSVSILLYLPPLSPLITSSWPYSNLAHDLILSLPPSPSDPSLPATLLLPSGVEEVPPPPPPL